MKIGVLALQGAFLDHKKVLERCGVEVVHVRLPEHLEEVQGIIIPGGESTTIGKLMIDFGLKGILTEKIEAGMPVFGTCAGMILLAKNIYETDQPRLGIMDITVKRNAFGRQVDSFEAMVNIPVLGNVFPAVFIRAPYIMEIEPNVSILAEFDGKIVMARQGNILACAFHPELTNDDRIHQYFISMIKEVRSYS
ncbi:MAG: pyridoxal 5'-phosphate synthase glutaminase subunit PdxT [Bacillota bacterium]|nr:pyridoxal 5'-phosphate synthase glutaminase subunit PdxT [Bacillota bacterium]